MHVYSTEAASFPPLPGASQNSLLSYLQAICSCHTFVPASSAMGHTWVAHCTVHCRDHHHHRCCVHVHACMWAKKGLLLLVPNCQPYTCAVVYAAAACWRWSSLNPAKLIRVVTTVCSQRMRLSHQTLKAQALKGMLLEMRSVPFAKHEPSTPSCSAALWYVIFHKCCNSSVQH